MEPQRIWDGEAAGDRWQIVVTAIYDGPLADPGADPAHENDGFVAGSRGIRWLLTVTSSGGVRLQSWWDPESHILGGEPLRGWNTSAIGALKRHLISLGARP